MESTVTHTLAGVARHSKLKCKQPCLVENPMQKMKSSCRGQITEQCISGLHHHLKRVDWEHLCPPSTHRGQWTSGC